jgi:hypothetical protein
MMELIGKSSFTVQDNGLLLLIAKPDKILLWLCGRRIDWKQWKLKVATTSNLFRKFLICLLLILTKTSFWTFELKISSLQDMKPVWFFCSHSIVCSLLLVLIESWVQLRKVIRGQYRSKWENRKRYTGQRNTIILELFERKADGVRQPTAQCMWC